MAGFNIDIPDDMFGLEDMLSGELGKEMIDAALPELEREVKTGYAAHSRTGQLESSIKVHPARPSGGGYYAFLAPEGTRSDGKRNGEIAVYLEYGTGRQPSTPVIGPASKRAEGKVIEKMREVFDRKVGAT
jgi:hypothetical protein